MEENAESKEVQIKKLEATVKSLSEELIKVGGAAPSEGGAAGVTAARCPTFQGNGIIKKLQGEVRALVAKVKVKNSVTVSQERLLKDTADRLQAVQEELQSTQKQLLAQEEQVSPLPGSCPSMQAVFRRSLSPRLGLCRSPS